MRFDLQFRPHMMVGTGPRFGVTWAPFKSGKTTLRASAGLFYDYLEFTTYEQVQRVDGFHQQELTVLNPSYPTGGDGGAIPPMSRYFLSPALTMPRTARFSAGIEQALLPQFRVGVLYNYLRSADVLHGVNVNAPIDEVRPDPMSANVVEVVPDGRARQHTLGFTITVGAPLRQQLPANSPRVDWRRVNLSGTYTAGRFENNTDGDFSVAPSGSLAEEWGASPADIRHRANVSLNAQILKNFTTALTFTGFSGSPYTILTGLDDNADQIFNDRPVGVGRNTARGAAQTMLSGNFVYTLSLGRRGGDLPPGIAIGTTGGVNRVDTFARDPVRLRAQLFVNIQNLTNHSNYGGYSGVRTSPFFGLPTLVTNPRKVDIGINLSF